MSRKQGTVEAAGGLPILDEQAILERVDGNRDLLREIVELFLDAYPRQRDELGAAIRRGDAAEVTRLGHAIKGSVAFFASGPAVDLARDLETMGRRGDLAEAAATESALNVAMERLTAALAAFVAPDSGSGGE
jgi:HPt (histidine-containing phosphotransfer) domain-containing protein